MKDAKEMNAGIIITPGDSRKWIAPQLTVLGAGATAGGVTANTYEDAFYHS